MKCYICGHEIPEGKKYCPGCGRVVSKADRDKQQKQEENEADVSQNTIVFARPQNRQNRQNQQTNKQNSSVYRPASSKSGTTSDNTTRIPDIFSSDPNAPEYTDPHSYDKATADVINYDKMFMQRSDKDYGYEDDNDVKVFNAPGKSRQPQSRRAPNQPEYYDDSNDVYDDYYDDEENYDDNYYDDYQEEASGNSGNVTRGGKDAKPHMQIPIKKIIIIILVICAIVFCIVGIYQIGKQFELWGVDDSSSSTSEVITADDSSDDSDDNSTNSTSNTQTGIYTVDSTENNIFMYKSKTGDTIFATIPNGTVIKITEISGSYGETTYNSRTGWVKMNDLTYTPDAELEEDEDTTGSSDSSDSSDYEPGVYTVDTKGSGYVNVRSESSTDGEILTTVTDGQELTVDEIKSSWGHVTIDDIDGWIYMEYLTQE